jgi:hypothetical protein
MHDVETFLKPYPATLLRLPRYGLLERRKIAKPSRNCRSRADQSVSRVLPKKSILCR